MGFQLITETGEGNPLANSYATMEQAQSYFDARLYSEAWENADPNSQPIALATATRLIDANYKFDGGRSYSAQALAWPRQGCPNRERPGAYWPANAIPMILVNATCELAGELLRKNRLLLAEPPQAGIKSFEIAGELSFEFDATAQPGVLPPTVDLLLRDLGSNIGSTSTGGGIGMIRRVGRLQ